MSLRDMDAIDAKFAARERVLLLEKSIMAVFHFFNQIFLSTMRLVQIAGMVLAKTVLIILLQLGTVWHR